MVKQSNYISYYKFRWSRNIFAEFKIVLVEEYLTFIILLMVEKGAKLTCKTIYQRTQ